MNLPAQLSRALHWRPNLAERKCLLFALYASVFLLPFMLVLYVQRDVGSLIEGAVRIVHGQVFARDFFVAIHAQG